MPVSVLAAASSWSSLTRGDLGSWSCSWPPNQPPPMPGRERRHAAAAERAHAARPRRRTRHERSLSILRPDCVTTPLSEHLPGLLRTGIPYAIEPLSTPSGHCPAIRSLASGKTRGQAQRCTKPHCNANRTPAPHTWLQLIQPRLPATAAPLRDPAGGARAASVPASTAPSRSSSWRCRSTGRPSTCATRSSTTATWSIRSRPKAPFLWRSSTRSRKPTRL